MKSDRGENGANSEESEFLQCEFSVMSLFSESTFFMFASISPAGKSARHKKHLFVRYMVVIMVSNNIS